MTTYSIRLVYTRAPHVEMDGRGIGPDAEWLEAEAHETLEDAIEHGAEAVSADGRRLAAEVVLSFPEEACVVGRYLAPQPARVGVARRWGERLSRAVVGRLRFLF